MQPNFQPKVKSRDVFQMRNRKAIFIWAFMVFWFGMLFVFIYLYATQGVSGELGRYLPAAFGVFFVLGVVAAKWAFKQPIVSIQIENGRVQISERFILVSRSINCRVDEMTVRPVQEDSDNDGDPYFKLEVEVRSKVYVIFESHSSEETELKHATLLAAL